jgi:hypothetical protein
VRIYSSNNLADTPVTTEHIALLNLIVQSIVAIAIIATFWIMRRQLVVIRDGATGQNILSLVNYLQSPDVRDARTLVRRDLRSKPYANWSDVEKRSADAVCANYDVVAVLIFQEKLVPKEPFLRNWGPSIVDCFEILRPHILELQKPENSGPEYWDDFAQLYQECKIRH